jgi:hypothetical protein
MHLGMKPQPMKRSRYLQHLASHKAAPATKRTRPTWPQHARRFQIFELLNDSYEHEAQDSFMLIIEKNEKNKPWSSKHGLVLLTDQSDYYLQVAVVAVAVAALHQKDSRCHMDWPRKFQQDRSVPVLNGSAEACQ